MSEILDIIDLRTNEMTPEVIDATRSDEDLKGFQIQLMNALIETATRLMYAGADAAEQEQVIHFAEQMIRSMTEPQS